jgi:hypothetical protein
MEFPLFQGPEPEIDALSVVSGRVLSMKLALAYPWSLAPTSREHIDDFWRPLAANRMWRFSSANQAMGGIYIQLSLQQDDELRVRFMGSLC